MINPTEPDMTSINNPQQDDLAIQRDLSGVASTEAVPLAPEDIETGLPFSPEMAPVEGVPVVSDAELEKQALAHPGADGDPSTPE